MNRCSHFRPPSVGLLASIGLMLLALLLHLPVQAQAKRMFPQGTERSTIHFVSPPLVELAGEPERLGPGTRIYDERNRFVFARQLSGQTQTVNYVRDAAGNIREIWILSPAEARQDRRHRRDRRHGTMQMSPDKGPNYLN